VLRILVAAHVVVLVLVARNWAYVTTRRLYLERRVDAVRSDAIQRFDIEGTHVVPLIVTRGADRVSFATDPRETARLQVGLRPSAEARYSIEWDDDSSHRVLARGFADRPTTIASPYPTGPGRLALVSDGAVTWVDARIVRTFRFWPHLAVLALLATAALAWARRERRAGHAAHGVFERRTIFQATAVAIGVTAAAGASEIALRALGEIAPNGIAAERHDLGEVTRDTRWVDSPRYGRRLRANVDTINEWRFGDIVRMGYIPAPASAPIHRFAFHTDEEGFRNRTVRDRVDIAALGDSFTDAMTMAAEASWPSRLEHATGRSVQNYGTAGFGPQQELLVLKDFVAAHRPRLVILAYFSGNDMFDAEAFAEFQQSGGTSRRPDQGWRIKDVVSRADTWFVVSALRAGGRWLGAHQGTSVAAASADALDEPPAISRPSFERGMFSVPVHRRTVQWAFMPPYLNTLNFSEAELRARAGWQLTTQTLAEMQRTSHAFGAEFVVMFIPFKSQVYLPLLDAAFSTRELEAAFAEYLESYGRSVDVARLRANRLAQNHLMQAFCGQAGIPLFDATAALAARLAEGENVYFPDESHLNEAGEAALAEALRAFLDDRGLR
jgi:lysophospholipase L1-like esterase